MYIFLKDKGLIYTKWLANNINACVCIQSLSRSSFETYNVSTITYHTWYIHESHDHLNCPIQMRNAMQQINYSKSLIITNKYHVYFIK